MANKIHFLATKQGEAACAVGMPSMNGKVHNNRRSTYASIPAAYIVRADEFRETPAADRCAHCAAQFTARMNARRTISGKPLYKDAFSKTFA